MDRRAGDRPSAFSHKIAAVFRVPEVPLTRRRYSPGFIAFRRSNMDRSAQLGVFRVFGLILQPFASQHAVPPSCLGGIPPSWIFPACEFLPWFALEPE